MLNPPPNYSEDNDFLLDVYRLPDDSVLYWRIIAYDLRSDFIWNISKRDSRLQTWQKYVLNSDLKTFAYSASTSISRDEAIKELFYNLPNDNSIHTGTLYHIQTLACIVQKYVNSTYGSIIVFGYSEGLQRYTVGSNGWKKYKYAETEVTMS